MKSSSNAPDRLLSFIERIERLEEEKRSLAADIADIKKDAKSAGFDPKVINQMIRERKMSAADREEWQALCETYRAALGMLDGTPLGHAARRRFMPPGTGSGDSEQGGDGPEGDDTSGDGGASASSPERHPAAQPTADDEAAAKAQGVEAAAADVKIVANPYAFDDIRRAAWDEGWCQRSGSDGMDLPAAWRRAKPAKKSEPDHKGGGPGGAG